MFSRTLCDLSVCFSDIRDSDSFLFLSLAFDLRFLSCAIVFLFLDRFLLSPMANPQSSNPLRTSPIDENHPPSASLLDPNSNPMYVYSADHAGISLFSEKLAGLGNFNTWHRSMIMTLGARNKVVFVDGTYPELYESHPDYASWSRCKMSSAHGL